MCVINVLGVLTYSYIRVVYIREIVKSLTKAVLAGLDIRTKVSQELVNLK